MNFFLLAPTRRSCQDTRIHTHARHTSTPTISTTIHHRVTIIPPPSQPYVTVNEEGAVVGGQAIAMFAELSSLTGMRIISHPDPQYDPSYPYVADLAKGTAMCGDKVCSAVYFDAAGNEPYLNLSTDVTLTNPMFTACVNTVLLFVPTTGLLS